MAVMRRDLRRELAMTATMVRDLSYAAGLVRVRVRMKLRVWARARVRVKVRAAQLAAGERQRRERIGRREREQQQACNRMCSRLQPYVLEAAAMCRRLQPYVSEAAALCVIGEQQQAARVAAGDRLGGVTARSLTA